MNFSQDQAKPKPAMPEQEWKAYLQPPTVVVQATQTDIDQSLREASAMPTVENLLLVNSGLKRKNKSLRKKLARARLGFNRIMAETREAPDWYYESEVDSMSHG